MINFPILFSLVAGFASILQVLSCLYSVGFFSKVIPALRILSEQDQPKQQKLRVVGENKDPGKELIALSL